MVTVILMQWLVSGDHFYIHLDTFIDDSNTNAKVCITIIEAILTTIER